MKERPAGIITVRSGFTLVELVVVVAIVLVLAGGAMPAIQESIERGRVQTAALQLAQDLRLVRENAIVYQSDLYFYVATDTTANTWYAYEQMAHLGSNGLPDGNQTWNSDGSYTEGNHTVPPADGAAWPDAARFVRKSLPFNMHVLSVTSSAALNPVLHNGRSYYEIRFRSGQVAGSIPGSVNWSINAGSVVSSEAPVTIVVGTSTGVRWQVTVDALGRPHVTQVTS